MKFAREFAKECPGFETDIHGLVELEDEQGEIRYYADCVMESDVKAMTKAPAKAAAKQAAAKAVAKPAAKAAAKPAAARRGKAAPADMDVRVAGTAARPGKGRKVLVEVGDSGPFGRTL